MKIMGNGSVRRLVLVVALSTGLGFEAHADDSYLIDLNTKTATSLGNVWPSVINDTGQVAGFSYPATEWSNYAFITGPNGVGITDLDTPAGQTFVYGVNAAGQVVGTNSHFQAFITGPNGVGVTNLGTPGGSSSGATGISAVGQVAGNFYTDTGGGDSGYHAFITGPNGVGMTDLDTRGGSQSYADGINAAGQVVGWSFTASGGAHEFITGPNGVGMTDLGTLGGSGSNANGINASGQVVGESYTATGGEHAFITGPDGVGMTDLGTLGGRDSFADGINDAGQVVGWSDTASGGEHAFITGPNGVGMTDLNSLVDLPAGVVLGEATAINNMGQVVAVIPEPESYAMMLAGLTLMGVMVRRKQKG